MASCADNLVIPAKVTAGLTFEASATLPDYRAPTWASSMLLRGPSSIDLAGVGDGESHTFTADPQTTAAWVAGVYWYSVRVTDGSQAREVANGQIEFLPDFAGLPAGYDGRSQNEIALDAIKAVLAKRATRDQERYTIDNRELWRTPVADLIKLRALYVTLVRRERAATSGSKSFGRPIVVRFS